MTENQKRAVQGVIKAWFPGANNAGIRSSLRAQVARAINDGRPVRPGYGTLFLEGDGDARTRLFHADLAAALDAEDI